jgi:alpha-mannosidase
VPALAARFDVRPVAHVAAASPGILPPRQSIVSLEPGSLRLTALKRAEDDDRLLLRFYSVADAPVRATIRFGFRAVEAFRSTASERIAAPVNLSEDGFRCTLEVRPAEIVTLAFSLAAPLGSRRA